MIPNDPKPFHWMTTEEVYLDAKEQITRLKTTHSADQITIFSLHEKIDRIYGEWLASHDALDEVRRWTKAQ
jgi:hypothetical protein